MKGIQLRFPSLAKPVAACLAVAIGVALPAGSGGGKAQAQTAVDAVQRGASGLPLPRFVSLKSGRVNSRIGPGVNYAVDWMYLKSGMPMEIIQEYDNWRRVRDPDGAEGWVNQSLLSGRRTAIVAPWQRGKTATIPVMAAASSDAAVVAQVEPGVIGTIKTCNGDWCEMSFDGHDGWMNQALVWGAYPGETVKD